MPSPWEVHPLLGILHLAGECSCCDAYATHIITSKQAGDSEFIDALQSLWGANFHSYTEGVNEGLRRATAQGAMYPPNLVFHAGLEEGRRQNAEAIRQLEKEKTEALKIGADLGTELRSLQKILKESGIILDEEAQSLALFSSSPSSSLTATSQTDVSSQSQQYLIPASESIQKSPSFSYAKACMPRLASCIPTASPTSVRTSAVPLCSSPTLAASPTSIEPASPRRPRVTHSSTNNQRVLDTLRTLMRRAHQGDVFAFRKVKSLCREAHATPPEHKTFAQKFILSEWRNPQETSSGHRSSSIRDEGPHIINPRIDDPVRVWYEYLTVYRSSWPRGVRKDDLGRPHWNDLSASRTFARVRPPPETPSALRIEFVGSMIKLFTTPGAYALTLRKEGWEVSPRRDFRPYIPQESTVISTDVVARHFADCGVTVEEAEKELEGWAVEYNRKSEEH